MNHQKAKTPNGKASNGKASTAPAQPTVKNAPAVPPSKTASQPAKTGPPPVKSAPAIPPAKTAPLPVKPPPLFRRTDWLSFLITFLAVLIGYYLTLAPELTLEDSGELATGSFYAGIPHPPGYPVWTVYTWIWTRILPFGNVAWRGSVGVALGSAMAAGVLALPGSRGSRLLIEGIEE